MFEHGTLMPSYTDDVFRYLVNDGPPAYADGDVEAMTGWFALGQWTREEFSHAVAITGSPRASEAGVLDPEAWYAVRINSDGVLWAYEYKPADFAPWDEDGPMYEFDRAVEEYGLLTDTGDNEGWTHVRILDYDENGNVIPEDDPADQRQSSITPRNLPL